MAFGSFDSYVRVYCLKDKSTSLLKGHTHRVRALHWNTEVPSILVSGGDDDHIKGWNLKSKSVIFDLHEPSLSLTSFSSHPTRPFTLYSSHFDASIQQWSLLELTEIKMAMFKILVGLPTSEIIISDES